MMLDDIKWGYIVRDCPVKLQRSDGILIAQHLPRIIILPDDKIATALQVSKIGIVKFDSP